MHIIGVVAPNGLGHFRRTVNVFARLAERLPAAQIDLVCEAWQAERAADSTPALRKLRARGRLIPGVMAPGVEWAARASFTEARLLGWIDRLRKVPEMKRADLVVSDNLAGVLEVRPDAVLMGSFLWSDVLADAPAPAARAFVAHERALLAARPPMVCVSDLAMPGVKQRTAAVPVGWMCEEVTAPALVEARATPPRIAVLGGATGAADGVLEGVAAALRARGGWDVVGGRDFGFAPADYAACAAVVCRPGVGTLTECVAAGRPMLLAYEGGNPELMHNARACAALGIAVDLGPDPDGAAAPALLAALLGGRDAMARLSALRKDGLQRAAEWLAQHARPRAAARTS